MPDTTQQASTASTQSAQEQGRRTIIFFVGLGLLLVALTAAAIIFRPDDVPLPEKVRTLLRTYKQDKLDGELATLLQEPAKYYVSPIEHPLIGSKAPDFRLIDWKGESIRLGQLLENGPVVLIFYYGYWCDHCVVQLFDVNEDLEQFKKLGAQVVAVSADSAEETASKFQQFGKFDFEVLSDPDSKVAQMYACFEPESKRTPQTMYHGTFVIDRDGVIRWADIADVPFRSNKTLLYELARIQGRLPSKIPDPPVKP